MSLPFKSQSRGSCVARIQTFYGKPISKSVLIFEISGLGRIILAASRTTWERFVATLLVLLAAVTSRRSIECLELGIEAHTFVTRTRPGKLISLLRKA